MTESDLSSWSTDYLGRMVKICRQRVREAQEAFAASQQEERRMRKQLARTEDDEAYARRLADELELPCRPSLGVGPLRRLSNRR